MQQVNNPKSSINPRNLSRETAGFSRHFHLTQDQKLASFVRKFNADEIGYGAHVIPNTTHNNQNYVYKFVKSFNIKTQSDLISFLKKIDALPPSVDKKSLQTCKETLRIHALYYYFVHKDAGKFSAKLEALLATPYLRNTKEEIINDISKAIKAEPSGEVNHQNNIYEETLIAYRKAIAIKENLDTSSYRRLKQDEQHQERTEFKNHSLTIVDINKDLFQEGSRRALPGKQEIMTAILSKSTNDVILRLAKNSQTGEAKANIQSALNQLQTTYGSEFLLGFHFLVALSETAPEPTLSKLLEGIRVPYACSSERLWKEDVRGEP